MPTTPSATRGDVPCHGDRIPQIVVGPNTNCKYQSTFTWFILMNLGYEDGDFLDYWVQHVKYAIN